MDLVSCIHPVYKQKLTQQTTEAAKQSRQSSHPLRAAHLGTLARSLLGLGLNLLHTAAGKANSALSRGVLRRGGKWGKKKMARAGN